MKFLFHENLGLYGISDCAHVVMESFQEDAFVQYMNLCTVNMHDYLMQL